MKTVYVTKHVQGYGWGHKKNVRVSHDCILGRYLDDDAMTPMDVLYNLNSELKLDYDDDMYELSRAISHLDEVDGTDSDLRQIKKLAKLLKMRVRVFHGK